MSDDEIGGVKLPLPLRWWYRWAGKRKDVMSGQNFLFVPRDYSHKYRILAVVAGRLHFYVENQGVYQWATLPDGDDPPVFGRYEYRGRWAREKITLSEHLILTCLFEAVMCHANNAASVARLEEEKLAAIARHIPPLAIPPWRWLGMRFFAAQGAFMWAAENSRGKPYGKNRFRERRKEMLFGPHRCQDRSSATAPQASDRRPVGISCALGTVRQRSLARRGNIQLARRAEASGGVRLRPKWASARQPSPRFACEGWCRGRDSNP